MFTKPVFGIRAHVIITYTGDPGKGLMEIREVLENIPSVYKVRIPEVGHELVKPRIDPISLRPENKEPPVKGLQEANIEKEKRYEEVGFGKLKIKVI